MDPQKIIDLNVGGVHYTTQLGTLLAAEPDSKLHKMFANSSVPQDASGRYFLDRNGVHFGVVLDFLRDGVIAIAPTDYREWSSLRQEADHFGLTSMLRQLGDRKRGCITVSSSYSEHQSVVIEGPDDLCREVFGNNIRKQYRTYPPMFSYIYNEKVEVATEMLYKKGFRLHSSFGFKRENMSIYYVFTRD